MEKTIANKMTLYDLLTLIIPGSIAMVVMYSGLCPWIKGFDFLWIVYIAIFGIMFLIGLLLKNWALNKNKEIFDQNLQDIQETYDKFAVATFHDLDSENITYDDYCQDYYYAVDNNEKSKIAILESQVAFMRTMCYTLRLIAYMCLTLGLIYMFAFVATCYWKQMNETLFCIISILNLVGMIPCFLVGYTEVLIKTAHRIQMRIYEGVIYDSYYHNGPIKNILNNEQKE